MLVLSRKVGEKLVIGDEISVELIRIQGNRISLGLSAPANIKILRAELEQIDAQANPLAEKCIKHMETPTSRFKVPAVSKV